MRTEFVTARIGINCHLGQRFKTIVDAAMGIFLRNRCLFQVWIWKFVETRGDTKRRKRRNTGRDEPRNAEEKDREWTSVARSDGATQWVGCSWLAMCFAISWGFCRRSFRSKSKQRRKSDGAGSRRIAASQTLTTGRGTPGVGRWNSSHLSSLFFRSRSSRECFEY